LCEQDVLVVTAPGSGAEIIPFLKTWVNLPAAIGFTIVYAKACLLGCAIGCISSYRVQHCQRRGA
jgi:hypothetical protein